MTTSPHDTSSTDAAQGDATGAGHDAPPQPGSGEAIAPREHGGRKGPEPTRYGDWEKNGRCIDF